jgi:FKBP-type peptidyl-prolyl cis-trans isomerase
LVKFGFGSFTLRSLVSLACRAGTTKNTQNMIQENLPTALQIVDEKVGVGEEAPAGKKVVVHYVGTLEDGTKFDSSRDRGQPFSFTLGVGQVIKGWDEGVKGMKVGGLRKLIIPSDMAYGDSGIPGAIPPKATLIFEVELLQVI